MIASLNQMFNNNKVLLYNAGSLIGATIMTTGLGFVYWWLAAQMYSTDVVGLASAAISAMMLLGTLGTLGLGTLLIRELSIDISNIGKLLITALFASGIISFLIGFVFVILTPFLLPSLSLFSLNFLDMFVFSLGVMLTAVTFVLDRAFIGIEEGMLQFWRNSFFALSKLVALFLLPLFVVQATGVSIYVTWLIGNVFSLIILSFLIIRRGIAVVHKPEWTLLRRLGKPAILHHVLNLAVQMPGRILPIVVTAIFSPSINAGFFTAWMFISLALIIPAHLTTALYAEGSSDISQLVAKTQFTLKLSFSISLFVWIGILVTAYPVMSLYGKEYAELATSSLQILSFGIFPSILKMHYIAVRRIQDRLVNGVIVIFTGSILEIVFSIIGAMYGSLSSLSIGWVLSVTLLAIYVSPAIYTVIKPKKVF